MRRALEAVVGQSLTSRLANVVRRARHAPTRVAVAAMRFPPSRRVLTRLGGGAFDPLDPSFTADPYPTFRRLREQRPIYRSVFGVWLITRYDDAVAVLNDPRFAHPDYREAAGRQSEPGHIQRVHKDFLLSLNPPDHTRLRRMLGEIFAAYVGPELRVLIETETHRAIDRIEQARHMDAIADFALPVPVQVISRIFGLPTEDSMRCQDWIRHGISALGFAPAASAIARAETSSLQITNYFTALVSQRRARPGQDFVSALVRAQTKEPAFTDDELVANCILFFGAGFETTVAFLGSAIATLLRQRDAWTQLCANPSLIPAGVDELLRYEAPVQFYGRQAREDVVLAGQRIRRGQTVMMLPGAINRDPARFEDPDRLDFTRRDGTGITFGHGIHACLGRSLTRTEGQVALDILTTRLPALRSAGPPAWRPNTLFRAVDTLPVAW